MHEEPFEYVKLFIKRRYFISIVTLIFILMGCLYWFYQPKVYKSVALVAPAVDEAESFAAHMAGSLGSIGNLAGINLSDKSIKESDIALAMLTSKKFLSDFIEKNNIDVYLLGVDGWDSVSDRYRYSNTVYDETSKKWIGDQYNSLKYRISESYKEFSKNVFVVIENRDNGMLTLSIESVSPTLSKDWLTKIIDAINITMKQRAIAESEKVLLYLDAKIAEVEKSSVRDVFYELIEQQQKKRMLAEVRDQYSFQVIDPPDIPNEPKHMSLIVALFISSTFGLVIALFLVVCLEVVGIARSYGK